MDTDDSEEETVEEDAGDEWDDGRCGQDEYGGMQVACDDQEEEGQCGSAYERSGGHACSEVDHEDVSHVDGDDGA